MKLKLKRGERKRLERESKDAQQKFMAKLWKTCLRKKNGK
jgi:hypothetical protein